MAGAGKSLRPPIFRWPMATNPFWKGYLKLSLVTCPVTLSPSVSARDKLRFHTVNRATGNRVASRYIDAETGKTVDPEDEARGYEREDGRFVVLTDEELDAVALDSRRTIDIEMFVKRQSIDWIWLDRPYYVHPADEVGEEAYLVIRDAMQASGMVGMSRVVLGRRENALVLAPCGRGIVAWTLRYGDEVRASDASAAVKTEPVAGRLVARVISGMTRKWDEKLVRDEVQEKLADLIEAARKKQAKKKPSSTAKGPSPAGNVISITEALRKSLAAEKNGAKGKSR